MNKGDAVAVIVGVTFIALTTIKKRPIVIDHDPDAKYIEDRDGSDGLVYLTGSTPVIPLLDNRVTPIWGHLRVR